MGRLANDGRGRIGDRAKGTKNKPQQPLNDWAATLVNQRRLNLNRNTTPPANGSPRRRVPSLRPPTMNPPRVIGGNGTKTAIEQR